MRREGENLLENWGIKRLHSPCAAWSTMACNFWCSILTLMISQPMHKNMPNAWLVPTTTIAVRKANMKKFDTFWYANVILVAMNASIWNEMYHTVMDSKKSLIGSVRRRVKMRNRTIVNSFNASTLNVIADIVLWVFLRWFFSALQLNSWNGLDEKLRISSIWNEIVWCRFVPFIVPFTPQSILFLISIKY